MEYPTYPGKMTWRMRKMVDKWQSDFQGDTESSIFQRAKQTYIESIWRHECEAAEADGILKALKEQSYSQHRSQKSDKYMVTLNFPEEATQKLPEILQTTQKWSEHKHINDIEYVFEQRSETEEEMGKGMHIHAIVTTDTVKSDLLKRTYNTFKNHLTNIATVDIRPIPQELLASKKAYIRGEKKGDEKKRKCIIDKIWRAKYCLKPLYNKHGIHEKKDDSSQAQDLSSSQANDNDSFGNTTHQHQE